MRLHLLGVAITVLYLAALFVLTTFIGAQTRSLFAVPIITVGFVYGFRVVLVALPALLLFATV